jgi:site-specific DNA-methyltransferase (cytosine-N4-specific)
VLNNNQISKNDNSREYYRTKFGKMYWSRIEEFVNSYHASELIGKVNLILTSPPFPLNRKKQYGNEIGKEYIEMISSLAVILKEFLTTDGSIVLEIGNAWEKGNPTMSTLPIKTLLSFLDKGKLKLCEQFVCYNPARLPGPTQWVNVDRIRVKDAFTNAWWMSPSSYPKANNRNVLTEYSPSMKKLLKSQKYNSGKRPSEHHIGSKSFLQNNGGAIPSNVLIISNTESSSEYLKYCKSKNLDPHPARMPYFLAKFFIEFLTEPGDLVMDPFAGSNTTGYAAETLGRRWLSIEANETYIRGSIGRFGRRNVILKRKRKSSDII